MQFIIELTIVPTKHGVVTINLIGQHKRAQQQSLSLSEFATPSFVIHSGDLKNSARVGKQPIS